MGAGVGAGVGSVMASVTVSPGLILLPPVGVWLETVQVSVSETESPVPVSNRTVKPAASSSVAAVPAATPR